MNKDDKDARDNIGATGAVPRRPGAGHAPESTGLPTKGGDDPLVRFLAENTDLSPKQARELIREHGHDRQRLLEIARTMKAEG